MGNRKAKELQRFKENERVLSMALIVDVVVFILFLLAAGFGVGWLKVLTVILAVIISALGLAVLYLTGELRRQRSRYLLVGFASVVVCILVSLIANYPSPAKAADAVGDAEKALSVLINLL